MNIYEIPLNIKRMVKDELSQQDPNLQGPNQTVVEHLDFVGQKQSETLSRTVFLDEFIKSRKGSEPLTHPP